MAITVQPRALVKTSEGNLLDSRGVNIHLEEVGLDAKQAPIPISDAKSQGKLVSSINPAEGKITLKEAAASFLEAGDLIYLLFDTNTDENAKAHSSKQDYYLVLDFNSNNKDITVETVGSKLDNDNSAVINFTPDKGPKVIKVPFAPRFREIQDASPPEFKPETKELNLLNADGPVSIIVGSSKGEFSYNLYDKAQDSMFKLHGAMFSEKGVRARQTYAIKIDRNGLEIYYLIVTPAGAKPSEYTNGGIGSTEYSYNVNNKYVYRL